LTFFHETFFLLLKPSRLFSLASKRACAVSERPSIRWERSLPRVSAMRAKGSPAAQRKTETARACAASARAVQVCGHGGRRQPGGP